MSASQDEPTKVRVVLAPGKYKVVNRQGAALNEDVSLKSKVICVLEVGREVDVVEVMKVDAEERVRARITNPDGWISLVNTKNGFRWAAASGTHEAEQLYGKFCDAAQRSCRALQSYVGQISKAIFRLETSDEVLRTQDLICLAVQEAEKSNEQVLRLQKLDGHSEEDVRYRKVSFDVGIAARVLEHLVRRVDFVVRSSKVTQSGSDSVLGEHTTDLDRLHQIYTDRTSTVGLPVQLTQDKQSMAETLGTAASNFISTSWEVVKADPKSAKFVKAASGVLSKVSKEVDKLGVGASIQQVVQAASQPRIDEDL